MEFYLDLDQTLTNDQEKILNETKDFLKQYASSIYILTEDTCDKANSIIQNKDIKIISVLENKMLYNNQSFCPKFLEKEMINHLLKKIPIITAYTISSVTEIISYQARLKLFYPNTFLKLIHQLDHNVSFLILAIEKKYYHELEKELASAFIQIMGEDSNKYILKITACPSTKEDWIKRVKKSPALGIGDSLQDYSFLKHCDYSVA
ncbi:MAG: HAD hydrolase family protein, partial [Anaeroplasmataceae bacterium]|nr:HAD hydrolase family protein [Anaeroplasmataceae bacterium]